MNDPASRTDRNLYEAAAAGDAQAYAELAVRHARGLYDFALRGTLDEQQAGDVIETVFERIRQPGTAAPSQIDVRTWLYSLGLVEVLAVSNETRTARISTDDERFFQTTNDVQQEIAHWAWQAARGLRTRDYCVLDLTLRRGLTPEEVAEAASLTRSNLYASIGRARGAFEETFAAMLLFEHGREACAELDDMVDTAPGTSLRPALRHQIIEHSDSCDVCRRTLDAMPLGASVYVSLADIEMPQDLARGVMGVAAAPPLPAEPVQPIIDPEALPAAAAAFAAGAAALDIEPESPPEPDFWSGPLEEPSDAQGEEAEADADAAQATAADDTEADEADGADDDDQLHDHEDEATEGERELAAVGAGTARVASFEAAPTAASVATLQRRQSLEDSEDDVGEEPSYDDRPRKQPLVWTYALLGVLAVLAIYLGIAVADSLESGGGDSGAVPLDSPASAAGPEIDCGDTAIEMDAGTASLISFDPDALDGYEIRTLSFQPVSDDAAFEDLEATLEDPFSIRFVAKSQDAPAERMEEFALRIQWQREDETANSTCALLVNVTP